MRPEYITEKTDHTSNGLRCATGTEPSDVDTSTRAPYVYEQPHEDVNRKDGSQPPDQQTSATRNKPHGKKDEEDEKNRCANHAAIMAKIRP